MRSGRPWLALGVAVSALALLLLSAYRGVTQPPPAPPVPAWTDVPVDLSPLANARADASIHPGTRQNDFRSLLPGPRDLGGTRFELGPLILLAGRHARDLGAAYPEEVKGVRVGRRARRIHLLLGTGWSETEGAAIARIRFRYAGGGDAAAEILYGPHVRDWWDDGVPSAQGAEPVWRGVNPEAKAYGRTIRLYKWTWTNPRPEEEVESLDVASTLSACAPFLVAVTAEAAR